jgi:hypothetical protein
MFLLEVCNELTLWLHSVSAACGTYITALVCIYYVRTSCSYLFILRYFKQVLMCYKGIVHLFQKEKEKDIHIFHCEIYHL